MTAEGESECTDPLHSFNTLWSSDGSDNPPVPEVLWDGALPYPTYTALRSSSRQTAARNESWKKRSGRAQSTVFLRWIKNKWWFRGDLIRQVPSTSHSHSLISLRCFGGSVPYKTHEQIATKKPVRQNTRKHENGKMDGACFRANLGWICFAFFNHSKTTETRNEQIWKLYYKKGPAKMNASQISDFTRISITYEGLYFTCRHDVKGIEVP